MPYCRRALAPRQRIPFAPPLTLYYVGVTSDLRLRPGVLSMTVIPIPLSDERLTRLRLLAEEAGLSPEEFLRRRVDQLLQPPDEAFRQAAAYVLEKNAELYRRLA